MTVERLVPRTSESLRTKCEPVTDFEKARETVRDLDDTIGYLKTTYAFPRGIGLAAPQIGRLTRVSVAEYGDRRYVLINPEIIEKSERKVPIREGCISFLQYRGMVPRYEYVKVKAYDENGQEYEVEGQGAFAMLLQHEIDHLDGMLYIDHLPNGDRDLSRVNI